MDVQDFYGTGTYTVLVGSIIANSIKMVKTSKSRICSVVSARLANKLGTKNDQVLR